MAQTDLLKRYLDAGVAFTQLTQQRAEEIVRDLVRAGEVQASEAQARVTELVERSRQNTEGLLEVVRAEVRSQVAKLGLVPKKEVDALRQELADLRADQDKVVTKKAPAPKKAAPAKKVVAPAAEAAAAADTPADAPAAPAAPAVKAAKKKAPAAKKAAKRA